MEAPEKMPFQPLGAKPLHVETDPAGTQLWKSKKRRPMTVKKSRIISLIETMIVLKRLDSLTPTTSSQVSASTISTAKRLKTTGWPMKCGAAASTSAGAPLGHIASHIGMPQFH